ncbi:hypothetical protein SLA2020_224400 [Shorea laevis]
MGTQSSYSAEQKSSEEDDKHSSCESADNRQEVEGDKKQLQGEQQNREEDDIQCCSHYEDNQQEEDGDAKQLDCDQRISQEDEIQSFSSDGKARLQSKEDAGRASCVVNEVELLVDKHGKPRLHKVSADGKPRLHKVSADGKPRLHSVSADGKPRLHSREVVGQASCADNESQSLPADEFNEGPRKSKSLDKDEENMERVAESSYNEDKTDGTADSRKVGLHGENLNSKVRVW